MNEDQQNNGHIASVTLNSVQTGGDGDTKCSLICSHVADRSLLKEGFTFSGAMVCDFMSWFGILPVGETREIVIRLDGIEHRARVGNRAFNRVKWPEHPDMYQLRYNPTGTLAQALQKRFSATRMIIERTLRTAGPSFGKRHIKIPADQREQILFYRTSDPRVWEAEVQTADETNSVSRTIQGLDEVYFESASWTDMSAHIDQRHAIVKVRRLDRTIGENLKIVYNHRCQICGEQVSLSYGTYVDEVHHIVPFVTSLNNDASNLIVLCPNHHRIVHSTHAQFRRITKSFAYPNGLVESLKVNLHL